MEKTVTIDDVKHIAELSRLEFSDGELGQMRVHLQKMVDYFDLLDSVDVSDVPPTSHILSEVNVLRDDVIAPSLENAVLLENAPKSEDGCFIVPRVVE